MLIDDATKGPLLGYSGISSVLVVPECLFEKPRVLIDTTQVLIQGIGWIGCGKILCLVGGASGLITDRDMLLYLA